MKTIYIVDYIGIHSGVKYYIDSFKSELTKRGYSVTIMSNYTDNHECKPFFINHYKGNMVIKIISLMINLLRLKKFAKHNQSIVIYEAYGNRIDVPFIKIIGKMPNHVIDVHEAIAQNFDTMSSLKASYENLYSKEIKTVMSHSERTNSFLNDFGYKGTLFKVPHFRYNVDKNYNLSNVTDEVKNSIESRKINFLFFGNITESKGIDILIDSLNNLSPAEKQKINVIIAGKDFDGSINYIAFDNTISKSLILRFINDDELKYLYDKCDYVTLPYRKTSQSGILEMSFNFRKPIVATNIPYFKKTLEEFPSFGILGKSSDSKGFSKMLSDIIMGKYPMENFYKEEEYNKYIHRKEIKDFYDKFDKWIKRTK